MNLLMLCRKQDLVICASEARQSFAATVLFSAERQTGCSERRESIQ